MKTCKISNTMDMPEKFDFARQAGYPYLVQVGAPYLTPSRDEGNPSIKDLGYQGVFAISELPETEKSMIALREDIRRTLNSGNINIGEFFQTSDGARVSTAEPVAQI
ncbi:MAG: hypothetical protein DHS20C02_05900 [Micavibrio sp.]|nr:MAG: hypothetical protein DHS20C02_05900 [Micavibrio sp.]